MWDKLKGMVMTPEALAAEKAEDAGKTAAPPAASPLKQVATGLAAVQIPMQPSVSPEFVSAIRKVVMARNSALTQLIGAAEKLVDIIPDPTTRLKAAFKMAADGRTVQQVASAVDIHIADVEGEERRFKTAIDQKIASEVGALEQRVVMATNAYASAQQQIEQAQARIAELTNQMMAVQQDGQQAQLEANTKRAEIEQAQVQFKAAADLVRSELNGQKSAILSALS